MSVDAHQEMATSQYIFFRVGRFSFATPLLDLKEIVELQGLRAMPNTVPHFSGLLNLRGEIVGIVDLTSMFGYIPEQSAFQSILILDGPASGLGVKVDQVMCVQSIDPSKIDLKPKIVTPFPAKYLEGVTNFSGSLIPIMNLSELIGSEDVRNIKQHIVSENRAAI